ncbi:hypothetical protein AVEN_274461-1 [Araneus ventricosus]|uniref:Secreted protein n=1 Tax=Araneus ventricosus TaxID=182803 RepID=A0A4Y2AXI8_ARAVE|nr:hypothetical protein AVEN_274461-1 [Araneus ventricosus]
MYLGFVIKGLCVRIILVKATQSTLAVPEAEVRLSSNIERRGPPGGPSVRKWPTFVSEENLQQPIRPQQVSTHRYRNKVIEKKSSGTEHCQDRTHDPLPPI